MILGGDEREILYNTFVENAELPVVEGVDTIVTSTRIRLARNIANYPFPAKLEKKQAEEIVRTVRYEFNHLQRFTPYDIGEMTDEQAKVLQERHLISPALIRNRAISAAFITEDKDISVMVNEEDHLREQYITPGLRLKEAYESLEKIDDALDKALTFAYDDKFGYLTACPSNLGTGMRASVQMFLPGIAKYNYFEAMLPDLRANGMTVRGVYGEGSAAEGYEYQVSNQKTLGVSEQEILVETQETVKRICAQELVLRRRMLREDGLALRDSCMRAYGLLTNCVFLTEKELNSAMIRVKLGVALGFFKASDCVALNEFISNMRPASFKADNCEETMTEREQDMLRADITQKILAELIEKQHLGVF
jgi:protein arginine kinase